MHPTQLNKQSEIDAKIRELKAAYALELEKAKNSNSWVLTSEETEAFDDLPPVNAFLQEVFALRDIPDKLAAKSKQKIISLLRMMIHKDFDFLNLEHLLTFFKISVQKNLLKSFVYENLVLNTLFHLLERNLGHKQFDTAAFLGNFIEIQDCLAQRRNEFAFHNKVLARFSKLFQKNFYFYLETPAVVERISNFLIDSFLESVRLFGKLSAIEKGGQFTQFCLNEDCEFTGVAVRLLKAGIVSRFSKRNEFMEKLRLFVDQFPLLEEKFRESPLILTEFFSDIFGTFNAILSFGYLHDALEIGSRALHSFDIFVRLIIQGVRTKKPEFLRSLVEKNLVFLCSRASMCRHTGKECARLLDIAEHELTPTDVAKSKLWKQARTFFEDGFERPVYMSDLIN